MTSRSDEEERVAFTDKDIKMIQFSQKRRTGIAIPWRDEYIDVAKEVLSRARIKVGFNCWNFDDPVLLANGVNVGVTDDAMVMFSFFWSDLPKNLQTAAQMCGFEFPWKALGETDLAFYGCADADATLCVYQTMKEILQRESN